MEKKIDLNEFKKCGYSQEVNRQFLHPLGLSLDFNEDKIVIKDYRKNPENIIFDIKNGSDEDKIKFIDKADNIKDKQKEISNIRIINNNFNIEPLPKK